MMSLKLLKYELCSVIKTDGILTFVYLFMIGAGWLIGKMDTPFAFDLQIFVNVLTIIYLYVIIIILCTQFWKHVIQHFYGQRAGLIRMLPLKRTQINLTLVAYSVLILIYIVVSLFIASQGILALRMLLDELPDPSLCRILLILMTLQVWSILLSGMTGINLGYKRQSSKTVWSVVWGFLIYYGISFVIVGIIAVYAYSLGIAFFADELTLEMDIMKKIWTMTGMLMFASCFIMILVNQRIVSKGVDVD